MSAFRLASILRLRNLEEQQAAGELASANHSLSKVVERRIEIRAKLAGTSTDITSPGAIAAMSGARAASASMLADLAAMHSAAEVTADTASAAYKQARARALALEKLEIRHDQQQAQQRAADEQAALDEIAVSRRPARTAGGPA